MSKPFLEVKGLTKSYHDGERELKVLQGVSLEVEPGEAIAVIGMSGAGKSTLLHLLGGLDQADAGSVIFKGEDITRFSRTRMNEYRTWSVGFVFQFHHLLPEFSAAENVMMPALVARRPRSASLERARELLKEMGLADRESHKPGKLSGGEQQRVALARALMNDPAILLADEPTGNLDLKTGGRVIELLWKASVDRQRSLIIVTHEPIIAERANRIFQLRSGKLEPVSHNELSRQMAQS